MLFNQQESERKIFLNGLSENSNKADSQNEDLFIILYPKKIIEELNKINSAKKKQLLNNKKIEAKNLIIFA